MMVGIGRSIALFSVLMNIFLSAAHAEVTLEVQPDRSEVTEEESVSVKFKISSSETGLNIDSINFEAPDLVELNTFQSSFTKTIYSNGSFSLENTKQITKVLRPRKKGRIQINNIFAIVNGKKITHPPINITVTAAGLGTPPPNQYKSQQGITGNHTNRRALPLLMKSEVNKSKVYRGEQVIVSYYAYQRSHLKNIEITKFPTLEGFLREELEMPILKRRAKKEPVIYQGVPYQKELLTRYAAYPLKEGELKVDEMRLKAHYFAEDTSNDDLLDDPFFSFSRSMFPKVTEQSSAPLKIQVIPLPEAGKPAEFQGAVGEYSVIAAIDLYEVKAGEPVTLKLKIEGRGNLSSIESPQLNLPASMDLYDTKGVVNSGIGGVGEKVFEYLIIPQAEGDFTIPSISFAFFDPREEKYRVLKSEPFQLKVLPGKPGSITTTPDAPPLGASSESVTEVTNNEIIHDADFSSVADFFRKYLKALQMLGLGLFLIFIVLVLRKLFKKKDFKHANDKEKSTTALKELIKLKSKIGQCRSQLDIQRLYKELESDVLDCLTEKYQIMARSYSRENLQHLLIQEKKMPESHWPDFNRVMENSERMQFSSLKLDSELKIAKDQLFQDLEVMIEWIRKLDTFK